MGSERIELAYYRKSVKKNCATAQFFRIYHKIGSVRDYASTDGQNVGRYEIRDITKCVRQKKRDTPKQSVSSGQ